MKILITQSCTTLCNPLGCITLGSSVHRILQARMLEWVDIPFSRGSSPPWGWIQVSCIASKFFTIWAIWKAYSNVKQPVNTNARLGSSSLGISWMQFQVNIYRYQLMKQSLIPLIPHDWATSLFTFVELRFTLE